MILSAHQPTYLPWLGLFHKIALADQFVSFNQVQYQPIDWINRNKIKTPDGSIWLTIPMLRKGYMDKKIIDIEINNDAPWARKHWNSLLHNYKKSPYFKKYADYFETVYQQEWETLIELNESMLEWFLSTLGIAVPVLSAADYESSGKKSDLVLDMCLQLKADTFLFGEQGKNYANTNSFINAGVTPIFQDYRHPTYSQLYGEFKSHLSIVDLLFNCGDDSLSVLMADNLDRAALRDA